MVILFLLLGALAASLVFAYKINRDFDASIEKLRTKRREEIAEKARKSQDEEEELKRRGLNDYYDCKKED